MMALGKVIGHGLFLKTQPSTLFGKLVRLNFKIGKKKRVFLSDAHDRMNA
jgi:hypothetical protein